MPKDYQRCESTMFDAAREAPSRLGLVLVYDLDDDSVAAVLGTGRSASRSSAEAAAYIGLNTRNRYPEIAGPATSSACATAEWRADFYIDPGPGSGRHTRKQDSLLLVAMLEKIREIGVEREDQDGPLHPSPRRCARPR